MITKLHIEGMSCGNCVRHATNALTDLTGVESAQVDLESKSATIEHSSDVSVQQLINAVNEEGYEASLLD